MNWLIKNTSKDQALYDYEQKVEHNKKHDTLMYNINHNGTPNLCDEPISFNGGRLLKIIHWKSKKTITKTPSMMIKYLLDHETIYTPNGDRISMKKVVGQLITQFVSNIDDDLKMNHHLRKPFGEFIYKFFNEKFTSMGIYSSRKFSIHVYHFHSDLIPIHVARAHFNWSVTDKNIIDLHYTDVNQIHKDHRFAIKMTEMTNRILSRHFILSSYELGYQLTWVHEFGIGEKFYISTI